MSALVISKEFEATIDRMFNRVRKLEERDAKQAEEERAKALGAIAKAAVDEPVRALKEDIGVKLPKSRADEMHAEASAVRPPPPPAAVKVKVSDRTSVAASAVANVVGGGTHGVGAAVSHQTEDGGITFLGGLGVVAGGILSVTVGFSIPL